MIFETIATSCAGKETVAVLDEKPSILILIYFLFVAFDLIR